MLGIIFSLLHRLRNSIKEHDSNLMLLVLFFLFPFTDGYSQTKKGKQEEIKTVTSKSRWAFRTNAVDWLLTVPNLGIEYDLTNSVYNKLTFNLEGKWNWHTSHNYEPSIVFDLWEIRPEIRKYWRTQYRSDNINKSTLTQKLFSKERTNPKMWRAYYLGVYGSMNGYSFKFGKRGFQGNSYGIGLSAGYGIPLYNYKNHSVDIEFGGSIGLVYAKYDVYELDRENNSYVSLPEKSKDFHFVPFPVISDIRVSFVYRFTSIKEKYKMINHEKIQAKEKEKIEKEQQKDSIRLARHLTDSLKKVRTTYLKDSIRQTKHIEDSLKQIKKEETLKEDKLKRNLQKKAKAEKGTEEPQKSPEVSSSQNNAIIKKQDEVE